MKAQIAILVLGALAVGIAIGYILCYVMHDSTQLEIPEKLLSKLSRLRFVNRNTGEELREFKVLGSVKGRYEPGGELYETYVLGFEDRPGGAEADQDYLDLIVELKRAKGSEEVMVRLVQLGYDAIDVYLDGELLGRLRPAMELTLN